MSDKLQYPTVEAFLSDMKERSARLSATEERISLSELKRRSTKQPDDTSPPTTPEPLPPRNSLPQRDDTSLPTPPRRKNSPPAPELSQMEQRERGRRLFQAIYDGKTIEEAKILADNPVEKRKDDNEASTTEKLGAIIGGYLFAWAWWSALAISGNVGDQLTGETYFIIFLFPVMSLGFIGGWGILTWIAGLFK